MLFVKEDHKMSFLSQPASNFRHVWFLDKYLDGHNGFVCGGCFKNIFNNEKIKDIDVFFRSEDDFNSAVKLFKYSRLYKPCYENANVKCFTHVETGLRVELCGKIFGTPEEILKQFDFSITKFAFVPTTLENGDVTYQVIFDDRFFEDLHLRRLVIDGDIPYPMSTLDRMFRYAKYGYAPCREAKMKIVNALRELSEQDVELPESFYNGID